MGNNYKLIHLLLDHFANTKLVKIVSVKYYKTNFVII